MALTEKQRGRGDLLKAGMALSGVPEMPFGMANTSLVLTLLFSWLSIAEAILIQLLWEK